MSEYRQLIVGMNRIIDEIRQAVVFIQAVLDARRDMVSLLPGDCCASPAEDLHIASLGLCFSSGHSDEPNQQSRSASQGSL